MANREPSILLMRGNSITFGRSNDSDWKIVNQGGILKFISGSIDYETISRLMIDDTSGNISIGYNSYTNELYNYKININGDINLTGDLYKNGNLLLSSLNASHIDNGTVVVGYGGTGQTYLYPGSVIIGNGNDPIIQTSNLVWDNTNNRLGIGKTEPETSLDVNGIIKSSGLLCSDGPLMIDSNNNVNIGYGNLYIDALYNNIGIGTTQPTNKLHILGDTRIEGNLTVNGISTIVNTDVSNTEQIIITNDGTGPALIINQTGSEPIIEIQDDGEICFKIFDGGHIGIGTITKDVNVDISGNLQLSGIITGIGSGLTSLNSSNIDNGTLSVNYGGTGSTSLLTSSVLIGNGTNALIQPENLIWDTVNSFLGVGITNPITTLDVNGIIQSTGILCSNGALMIDSNNNVNIGYGNIFFDGINNLIGIGTTEPSNKLHVLGDARIQGNLTVNGISTIINTDVTTSEQMTITNDGTGPALIVNQTGSEPIIEIQDDGETCFKIFDGGHIGIGTSTKDVNVNISGNLELSGIITGIGSGLTSLNASNISSGTLPVTRGGTGTGTLLTRSVLIGNGTNDILQPTDLVWNNTSIRLGVGTTNPISTLDVDGIITGIGSGLTSLNATNISSGTLIVGRGGIGTTTLIAGRLLIGNGTNTLLQSANLNWNNTSNTLSATNFIGSGTGLTALNATNISSGTLTVERGGIGAGTLTSGQLLIGNGTGALIQSANLNWNNTSIRLGIGKTNPDTTLDVNGIIKSTGILCSNGALIIDSNNNINIGSGNLYIKASNNFIGVGTTLPNNKLHITGNAQIDGDLIVSGTTISTVTDVTNTEKLIITNSGTGPAFVVNQTGFQPIIEIQDDGEICFNILDGGDVGIGTSIKNANVDISGNLKLSGIITGNGSEISSLNASKILTGTLSVSRGGIGTTTLLSSSVLIGNGTGVLLQPTNLIWNNTSTRLGVGKTNPTSTLDVNGIITGIGSGLTSLNASNINSGTLSVGYGGIGTTSLLTSSILIGNGTNALIQPENLIWNTASSFLGIGKTNPETTLDVNGIITGIGSGLTSLNASNIDSGTLSVNYGGTGSTSLLTSSVLIGNGTNALIQPENLIWDTVNSFLGVGITNPITTLDVNGIIQSTGILCSNGALMIDSNNNVNIGYGNIYFDGIYNNIGIGTTEPTNKLHVLGDTRIQGNLTVNGTSTIVNTDVTTSEQIIITNDGTGPALIINQTGPEPIIEIQDDGEICFKILDGGHIEIGTSTKDVNVNITGNLELSGIIRGSGSELYLLNATNISSGTLPVTRGGTGTTTLLTRSLLVGNGINDVLQSTDLVWDNTSIRLGIGKTNPISTLDVDGIITGIGSGLTSLNATNMSSGTLIVARGGIGTTTLTSGQLLIGNGTGTLLQSANLTWNSTSNTLSATSFIGSGAGLTALNATNISSGTLTVARGGIGATTLIAGRVLIGNGTGTLIQSANLSWNNTSNTLSATSFIGSGAGLTALNATNISSGTLPITRGGIGAVTLTLGQLLIGNGTGTLIQSANLSWNNTSNTLSAANFIGSGAGLTTLNATNISSGTLPITRGGIGAATLTSGQLLIGNGTGTLIQSANLSWDNTSTRLGIGVTIPQRTAHIQSSLRIGGSGATLEFGDDLNNQIYKNNTNNDILIKTNGTNQIIINSLGDVGIGTTVPALKLHVIGDIAATGTVTASYSDERLKTITSKINNPLKIINNLNGFYYIPNKLANTYGINSTNTEIGLNAQEIQKELPEIVKLAPFDIELKDGEIISKSGQNYLTVSYERLIPVIIEAIKDLSKEINDIKTIINNK